MSSHSKDSIGVDLVELKKARAFYARHRSRLSMLLSRREMAYLSRSKKRSECLALLLAAKEAVWKKEGHGGVGIAGFRQIEIISTPPDRFSYRVSGALRRGKISFISNRDFVVAQCVGT